MSKRIRPIIEENLFWALYYGNGYSLKDMAKLFGCSQTTVRRIKDGYGIPSKDYNIDEWRQLKNENISKGERNIEIESEILWAFYWGIDISVDNIAEIFDCSSCVIYSRMNEAGIPRKTLSEAKIGKSLIELGHKDNCQCGVCKAKRGEYKGNNSPSFGIPKSDETKRKISSSHKGKEGYWKGKPRPEMCGENNPNWKDGITDENKSIRHSIEYNEWRKAVYERDRWTCQECGIHCDKYNIIAHHPKSFADYPELRFDVDNGRTLCRACHARLHNYNGIKKT